MEGKSEYLFHKKLSLKGATYLLCCRMHEPSQEALIVPGSDRVSGFECVAGVVSDSVLRPASALLPSSKIPRSRIAEA